MSRAGRSLAVIAGIHTLLGVLAGARIVPDPLLDGFAGDRIPLREITPGFVGPGVDLLPVALFWFLAFGMVIFPLAWLIHSLERSGQAPPRALGFQLAAVALIGGIFLPASGFWLVLIPAIQILRA